MLTWNPELADRRPEWLVVREPGGTSSPDPVADKGYQPWLWQFCICQEGFVQGELESIEELVSEGCIRGE